MLNKYVVRRYYFDSRVHKNSYWLESGPLFSCGCLNRKGQLGHREWKCIAYIMLEYYIQVLLSTGTRPANHFASDLKNCHAEVCFYSLRISLVVKF